MFKHPTILPLQLKVKSKYTVHPRAKKYPEIKASSNAININFK